MKVIELVTKHDAIVELNIDLLLNFIDERIVDARLADEARKVIQDIIKQNKSMLLESDQRYFILKKIVFTMCQDGFGRISCPICKRWYRSEQTILERYERGRENVPLIGGSGRRIYCGNDHILFQVVDARS